jgi:hypothetical protein
MKEKQLPDESSGKEFLGNSSKVISGEIAVSKTVYLDFLSSTRVTCRFGSPPAFFG